MKSQADAAIRNRSNEIADNAQSRREDPVLLCLMSEALAAYRRGNYTLVVGLLSQKRLDSERANYQTR